ncbi:alpha/beta fold hydrolase [Lentzea flava]|uniref:Alpha/beta hydrolase n=1 Tax=Lentzea flava TaxID=103732 RepID=A0ABQ2VBJ8_9PSEU|nr:alpha/beta hydrolase [Lentzea flava]MCP2204234.1 Pimeloyl-ACP methyl ester carboxylesterase [Lentzea flava]GGU75633.1 alpha/beta hydrolase [Lentzea flava]
MVPLPTLNVGGVTVAYRLDGPLEGQPTVLLHALASNSATWTGLTRDLVSAGRLVIAPDLRGHGHSAWTGDYRLDSVQRDVVGVLDALDIAEFDLIGHSLGAHIAALLAGRRPDRVRKLVLEDPPPPPRSGEPRPPKRGVALTLALQGLLRAFDRRMVPQILTQLRAPDPAWWDGLAAIKAPTLVISGGPRSHVPLASLEELTAEIPHAELITINAGHRVHSTRPGEFRDAVLRFLGGRS